MAKTRGRRRYPGSKNRAGAAVATTPTPRRAKQPSSPGSGPMSLSDFAREYEYVFTDIRNVLLVSVVMFIVLIALSYTF